MYTGFTALREVVKATEPSELGTPGRAEVARSGVFHRQEVGMDEGEATPATTGVCTRGMHLECSGAVLEFLNEDVRRSLCGCWCHSDGKEDETRDRNRYPNMRASRWAG